MDCTLLKVSICLRVVHLSLSSLAACAAILQTGSENGTRVRVQIRASRKVWWKKRVQWLPSRFRNEKLCLVLYHSGRGGENTVSGLEYFQHLGWQVNFKQSPAGIWPGWEAQYGSFLFPFHYGPRETTAGGESTFSQIFPNSLRH